jgi:hypothetical protein
MFSRGLYIFNLDLSSVVRLLILKIAVFRSMGLPSSSGNEGAGLTYSGSSGPQIGNVGHAQSS